MNDLRLARKAGEEAALKGLPPDPTNFLTRHLGALTAPATSVQQLDELVYIQQEEIIRAKITTVDQELAHHTGFWMSLAATILFCGIDAASSTSIMRDLGFDLYLSILQGIMLTCTLVALIAGVRQ
jgi:hypothetical protein